MKQVIASVILLLACGLSTFAQEQKQTLEFSVCGIPFDTFSKVPINEQKRRLDNFFVALRNDKTAKGFIILQLDKNESVSKRLKRFNEVSRHLTYRKIDRTKIVFVVYEDDSELTVLQVASATIDVKNL